MTDLEMKEELLAGFKEMAESGIKCADSEEEAMYFRGIVGTLELLSAGDNEKIQRTMDGFGKYMETKMHKAG